MIACTRNGEDMKVISKKLFGFLAKPLLHICKIVGITGVRLIGGALVIINRILTVITGIYFIMGVIFVILDLTNQPGTEKMGLFGVGVFLFLFLVTNIVGYISEYMLEYTNRALYAMSPKFEEPIETKKEPDEIIVHVVHHNAENITSTSTTNIKEDSNLNRIIEGDFKEHTE